MQTERGVDRDRVPPAPWKTALAVAFFAFVGAWFFTLLRWYNDDDQTPLEGFWNEPGFSLMLVGLIVLFGFAVWWAQRGWLAQRWSPIVISRMAVAPFVIAAIVWLISTR